MRVFDALTSTEGVVMASRRGLVRRIADELGDLQRTRAQLRAVEADMVADLGELACPGWRTSPPQAAGDAAAAADTGSRQAGAASATARARHAKARVACAASLLRWIYFIVVHDVSWDPDAASGPASGRPAPAEAA